MTIWQSTSNAVDPGHAALREPVAGTTRRSRSYADATSFTFGAGEGFALAVHLRHGRRDATPTQVCFGESANDEMCFIWAYYYPSVGHFVSTECIQ